ncbi:unnamed protein product [Vitrella brassicaformis CCMP3155]|uniref:Uncharacterized protein n=1 Tax=Vitrella brassicaformis (strain CCMP3155) TaxID=1169540 RepID=A0A0G4EL39_VITBC|nr:unnamed protein product [Vitrella brassicaformis CCMP3155]|eukprot:CEL97901.1 unnamed protein product [Vitrella brassicaformis CCMP3155]
MDTHDVAKAAGGLKDLHGHFKRSLSLKHGGGGEAVESAPMTEAKDGTRRILMAQKELAPKDSDKAFRASLRVFESSTGDEGLFVTDPCSFLAFYYEGTNAVRHMASSDISKIVRRSAKEMVVNFHTGPPVIINFKSEDVDEVCRWVQKRVSDKSTVQHWFPVVDDPSYQLSTGSREMSVSSSAEASGRIRVRSAPNNTYNYRRPLNVSAVREGRPVSKKNLSLVRMEIDGTFKTFNFFESQHIESILSDVMAKHAASHIYFDLGGEQPEALRLSAVSKFQLAEANVKSTPKANDTAGSVDHSAGAAAGASSSPPLPPAPAPAPARR